MPSHANADWHWPNVNLTTLKLVENSGTSGEQSPLPPKNNSIQSFRHPTQRKQCCASRDTDFLQYVCHSDYCLLNCWQLNSHLIKAFWRKIPQRELTFPFFSSFLQLCGRPTHSLAAYCSSLFCLSSFLAQLFATANQSKMSIGPLLIKNLKKNLKKRKKNLDFNSNPKFGKRQTFKNTSCLFCLVLFCSLS